MSDRVFLDTNVLVYAYDSRDGRKQAVAQALLRDGIENDSACLSAQVLSEFFTVVTRKIAKPLSAGEALDAIEDLVLLPVQEIDLPMVKRAIDQHQRHDISYWDALILAAAERAGSREVRSEDLSDGAEYDGVRIVNPFRGPAPPKTGAGDRDRGP